MTLVCVSMHMAPHAVVPPVQTHFEDEQACPLGHFVPQAPQLLESDDRSTHALLQFVVGDMQTVVHLPPWHTWPLAHFVPQVPQLLGSVFTSTQLPLQDTVPFAQTHFPPEQLCPAGQPMPQAPQLFESVCVLTHMPPHIV